MARHTTPLRDRIVESVVIDANGCWIWQRYKLPEGYGRIVYQRKWWLAHRASYTEFMGPIPDGLDLDHLCRTPSCVNPLHLEPVTRAENLRRSPLLGANNHHARKTHCVKGHEFTSENTARWGRGRQCRQCHRDWNREYQRRKAVA